MLPVKLLVIYFILFTGNSFLKTNSYCPLYHKNIVHFSFIILYVHYTMSKARSVFLILQEINVHCCIYRHTISGLHTSYCLLLHFGGYSENQGV